MALLAYTIDELDGLDNAVYENQNLVHPDITARGELDDRYWYHSGAIIDRLANPVTASLVGATGDQSDPTTTLEPQYIRGNVIDIDGFGVARVVIAIDRSNGSRLAITTSDVTGNFLLRPRTLDPCILIAVPLAGEQLNCVVLDNILPVPI